MLAQHLIAFIGALVMVSVTFSCKENVEQRKAAPAEPQVESSSRVRESLVERGRYLSDLMGCGPCHTDLQQGQPFAGGLEVPYILGVWRTTNITQHQTTGIGAWTDQQIIDAIREGKRPDGALLSAAMPYALYNVLSDDDAVALVAFLRTIEPVDRRIERVENPHTVEVPPAKGLAASPDQPVAHGEYLSKLMRCGQCHTPFNGSGSQLSGGNALDWSIGGEGKLYSSNLTPDQKTGIGSWSDAEVASSILQMKKRDGTLIQGPMALFQGGWSQMAPRDTENLIAYLRSLPPVVNEVPRGSFRPK